MMLKFPGDTMKSCPTCGKRVQVKSMRRHEVTHAGSPSFQCSECDTRPFRHKYQLDVHVANKHQGKTYVCNICNREFDSPNAVGVHRRDKHDLPGYVRCTIAECKSKKFLRRHAASHLDRVHDLRDVPDISSYVVDVPFGTQEETMGQQQHPSASGPYPSAHAYSTFPSNIPASYSSTNLGEPLDGARLGRSPSPLSSAFPSRLSVSPVNDMHGPAKLSPPVLMRSQSARGPHQGSSSDPNFAYTSPNSFHARREPRRLSETSEHEHNDAGNYLPGFNTLFPEVSRFQQDSESLYAPVPTAYGLGHPDVPSPFVQTVSSPMHLCSRPSGQRNVEGRPASPSVRSERFERSHSTDHHNMAIDAHHHWQHAQGSSRDVMMRTQTPPPSRPRRLLISDILNPDEHRPSSENVAASSRPRMYRPGIGNDASFSKHSKGDNGLH
ncbi:hypothetical protein BS47DRAFT_674162 [Hydnum rufescens UP504]|uniref:C2H2-type domain-containing protein n=1 Tax=Hydnum rufescens UP504 TaxID=1448309 RepID=A0A9P6B3J8_9AGAM|nr:hypothetical protein BS47DRAFT_674162 [Hydnum rufescens UP504]